jgi:hypothetical protein
MRVLSLFALLTVALAALSANVSAAEVQYNAKIDAVLTTEEVGAINDAINNDHKFVSTSEEV